MFQTADQALSFISGGKAIVTVKSIPTGKHFTYRFKAALDRQEQPTGAFFASVLTGPDNSTAYTYIGMYEPAKGAGIRATRNSKVALDAPAAKALTWTLGRICQGVIPDSLEISHAGKCGRCARTLTHPESLESGFGPECVKHV